MMLKVRRGPSCFHWHQTLSFFFEIIVWCCSCWGSPWFVWVFFACFPGFEGFANWENPWCFFLGFSSRPRKRRRSNSSCHMVRIRRALHSGGSLLLSGDWNERDLCSIGRLSEDVLHGHHEDSSISCEAVAGADLSALFPGLQLSWEPKVSEIRRREHWKRGICTTLSEINFKCATALHTLPSCRTKGSTAYFAHLWRAVCDKFAQCPSRDRPLLGISESTPVFGGSPPSRKASPRQLAPSEMFKLAASQEGFATSTLQFVYRITQKSSLPNLDIGGCQFAYWRLKLSRAAL